ncbi:MAG: hypothetical protein IPN69_14815 [Acidobacteria bacterium]|nr:hypothetical protein [Acidobacteriota bacterium]
MPHPAAAVGIGDEINVRVPTFENEPFQNVFRGVCDRRGKPTSEVGSIVTMNEKLIQTFRIILVAVYGVFVIWIAAA